MSEDDDFNLDELINSHSTRVIEGNEDVDLDLDLDFENELKSSDDPDVVDYNISDEIKFDEDIELDLDLELDSPDDDIMLLETEVIADNNQISTIEEFSRLVIAEIEKRDVPATPENYETYFMNFLPLQNEDLQEHIYKLFNKENIGNSAQKSQEMEGSIQKSLRLTQQLLALTTKVHNNINIMRNIVSKRDIELNSRTSANIVKLLKFDLGKLDNILEKQSESMKNIYSRSVESVNKVHENVIFDKNYGLYNRRYFMESLNNEVQKIDYFNHTSSVILLIPHKSLTSQSLTSKIAFVISQTISKLLVEHFNRNDIISYYGNNIFSLLITHSNLKESEEKIERLFKILKNSSLFITGKEIKLIVKVGIADLRTDRKTETSLMKALNALKIANKSNGTVCKVED